MLSQKQSDGEWHLVAYYSKTMINVELNYPIHDKEMLAIISSFQHQHVHLQGTLGAIKVVLDHKALEYFMTTKALLAWQARQAEILSQFNFKIMYRPSSTNQVDALTQREQDLDSQMAAKIALRTQTLLGLEHLDPMIQVELGKDQDLEIGLVNTSRLDFINELLQANHSSSSLKEHQEKAMITIVNSPQTLENGLLKHQDQLVIAKDQNLWTRLIAKAHAQVSIAHPSRNKTCKIIRDHYYQLGMMVDID